MTTAEIRAAHAAWRKLRADIAKQVRVGTPTRLIRLSEADCRWIEKWCSRHAEELPMRLSHFANLGDVTVCYDITTGILTRTVHLERNPAGMAAP